MLNIIFALTLIGVILGFVFGSILDLPPDAKKNQRIINAIGMAVVVGGLTCVIAVTLGRLI